MLRAWTRISAISHFFLSLLTEQLFSGDAKLTDSTAFEWQTISFPIDDRIGPGVMIDSANGWASRELGIDVRLYRLLDAAWQFVPPQNKIYLSRVFGFSPDNIWFIGYDKNRYCYFLRLQNYKTITDYYTPNADPVNQQDYLAPDNIWVVCQWGEIIHFDGTRWKLASCPIVTHITNISMANDSCGWAGGESRGDGVLLFWDGKAWKLKANLKARSPKLMMVNDTLGRGFMVDDSC